MNQSDLKLPQGTTWKEMIKFLRDGGIQTYLKKLHPDTLKYILDDFSDNEKIESIIKTLDTTDPKNAKRKYAENMLQIMKRTVLVALEQQ